MAKTILITGANRGIGLALTKLSLIKNLNIEACFRDKKKSEELQELSLEHPNLNIHEMDVTNSESIKKISQNINFKVDILVCNAGVNNGKGDIFSKEHNEQAIMGVMMANVAGPFLTIKNFYEIDYPQLKIEWIIVDDGTDSIKNMLPKFYQIRLE